MNKSEIKVKSFLGQTFPETQITVCLCCPVFPVPVFPMLGLRLFDFQFSNRSR